MDSMSALLNTADRNLVFYIESPFGDEARNFIKCKNIVPKYVVGNEIEGIAKLQEFNEIKEIQNPFVIMFVYPQNTEKITHCVEKLKEVNIPYCYYKFFYESYHISTAVLEKLDCKKFTDINQNKIEFVGNVQGEIDIKISKSHKSNIIIGKEVCSGKSLITIENGNCASVFIGNGVVMNSGNLRCFDIGNIKIASNTSIMDNVLIESKHRYTLVDSRLPFVVKDEHGVIIGKHTKICDNAVILDGTDLGDGSIVLPYSVVDMKVPKCCEVSGNRAIITKTEVSWAKDYIYLNNPIDTYDVVDREAYKYFDKKSLFIHGSCVSRTTMEYSKKLSVKYHVLQNPIHTMFYKGFEIPCEEIKVTNNSEFMRRTLSTEFNKEQEEIIRNNVADFFLMEISDIRWGYFEFIENPDVRLYAHIDIYNTLIEKKEKAGANGSDYEFVKKGCDSISFEDWRLFVDKYLDLILCFYSKEQIIFMRTPIAKGYYDKGRYIEFSKELLELKVEPLLRKLEDYIINEKLKDVKVVEIDKEVFGDVKHTFGNSPLHFTNDVYKNLAKQIDDYIESNFE